MSVILFYQIGQVVEVDEINRISKILGFTKLSGIEIGDQEDPGVVASSEWVRISQNLVNQEKPWVPEDIAKGHWSIRCSNHTNANSKSICSNSQWGKFSYTLFVKTRKKKPIKVDINPKHLKVVRNGLSKVVESGTGVSINHGYETKNFPSISGKTGTAEDSQGGSDHAWFVCFPSENMKQICICRKYSWRWFCSCITHGKKILEEWYKNK